MNQVTLIPAHPSYGVISMLHYWQYLEAAHVPDDPFELVSILGAPPKVETLRKQTKIQKAFFRRFFYPLQIRTSPIAGIAHILDHSWAEMIRHVPKRTRTVITVHDLIPLRFPEKLTAAQMERFRMQVSNITSADVLIAVSNYTKNEIIHYFDYPEDRIHVIPNGVNPPAVRPEAVQPLPLPGIDAKETYKIGSVGNTLERKNLDAFVAALDGLLKRIGRPVALIRAGDRLPESLAAGIRKVIGDRQLIELGRLSDEDLARFYRSVDVFAMPSLYEGFGLPVLEAMAWGTPVVSSCETSLMEVGGDAARYFDPRSAAAFQEALADCSDPGTLAKMSGDGLQHVRNYSWRATLESTYQVYAGLCG